MQVQLLVIDPQIDFCDPGGALSVAGADQDMARLAPMDSRAAGSAAAGGGVCAGAGQAWALPALHLAAALPPRQPGA